MAPGGEDWYSMQFPGKYLQMGMVQASRIYPNKFIYQLLGCVNRV
jgi:hypothetical protein